MIIGIDIDDVITNSSELIMEYAKKHFKTDDVELINNILNAKTIEGELLDFYYKYLPEMMSKYSLKENVKEVLDRLKLKGHEIIIITARGYTVQAGLIEITNDYFNRHNLIFDEIIFKTKDKKKICIEKNIDIMIDDSISVLESLKDANTKPLLFVSICNKDCITNFDKVSTWLELEKYINSNG
jgi:uncharacterized HAD superfamily protein